MLLGLQFKKNLNQQCKNKTYIIIIIIVVPWFWAISPLVNVTFYKWKKHWPILWHPWLNRKIMRSHYLAKLSMWLNSWFQISWNYHRCLIDKTPRWVNLIGVANGTCLKCYLKCLGYNIMMFARGQDIGGNKLPTWRPIFFITSHIGKP